MANAISAKVNFKSQLELKVQAFSCTYVGTESKQIFTVQNKISISICLYTPKALYDVNGCFINIDDVTGCYLEKCKLCFKSVFQSYLRLKVEPIMKIIVSNRRKNKISYKGFTYRKDKATQAIIAWRCEVKVCKGRLNTSLEYENEGNCAKKREHSFFRSC